MSHLMTVQKGFQSLLQESKESFEKITSRLDWEIEQRHLMLAIKENDKLMGIALSNPVAFIGCIVDLADLGLSLCKKRGQAYMVPRDGKVCLDIGYRGYIELGIRDCNLLAITTEEVYENDLLDQGGFKKEPILTIGSKGPHDKSSRGKLVGFYAKTIDANGMFKFEYMDLEEINKIRSSSISYTRNKNYSPWTHYYNQMAKKTILKRILKHFTKKGASLDKIIEQDNLDYQFDDIGTIPEKTNTLNDHLGKKESSFNTENIVPMVKEIQSLCSKLTVGFSKEEKISFMKNVLKVEKFEEIGTFLPDELRDMIIMLNELIASKEA